MASALMITDRVMIACVTTEVVKITHPAEYIQVDRIHLLNYVKDAPNGTEDEIARKEFYESIYSATKQELGMFVDQIVEHRDVKPYLFDACFHAIYDILIEEKNKCSDIYVNISGGSPEYAAAAAIASMMVDGVKLFSVGTQASGYTIDFKKQLELAYHDGRLVGSAFQVLEPIPINKFPLLTPDVDLLKSLKVFNFLDLNQRSNINVIRELIRNHLWRFALDEMGTGTSVELEDDSGQLVSSNDREEYTKRQRKEAVLYQRGYIDKWKKEGWIEKSKINGKRYQLTETGQRYVDLFCSDTVFKLTP